MATGTRNSADGAEIGFRGGQGGDSSTSYRAREGRGQAEQVRDSAMMDGKGYLKVQGQGFLSSSFYMQLLKLLLWPRFSYLQGSWRRLEGRVLPAL